MPTATFRNTVLRYLDVRHTEAGPICRIHLTADYSDSIIKAMADELGWEPLPVCSPMMKLQGTLAGGDLMTLTPNGNLAKNEIQIAVMDAKDFSAQRIEDGEEKTHDQLSLVVRTNNPAAIAELWDYMRTVGKTDGVLKMKYAEQVKTPAVGEENEKQPSLPGVDAPKNGKAPAKKAAVATKRATASVED